MPLFILNYSHKAGSYDRDQQFDKENSGLYRASQVSRNHSILNVWPCGEAIYFFGSNEEDVMGLRQHQHQVLR